MDELSSKFIEDIIEPWRKLDLELVEQVAIEPGASRYTRSAGSLAAAFKQTAEEGGLKPEVLIGENADYALVVEVAELLKRSLFASASKSSVLGVTAQFEADGLGKYKFRRNALNIEHKRSGRHDFLEVSKQAAIYLIGRLSLDVEWTAEISVSAGGFESEVRLQASPDAPPAGTSVNIQFLKRAADGSLVRHDPESWQFNLTPPA